MNALVRKNSVEELCAHRARATELYKSAIATLTEARKAHAMACFSKSHIATISNSFGREISYGRPEDAQRQLLADLDRDMWQALIHSTPIGGWMDREELDKLRKSLESNPPEATVENIMATMERLAADKELIFRRGLINAFSRLCRDYKSNDGFKLGERTVMTHCVVNDWGFRFTTYAEEVLRDVDRIMHVLDGEPAPDHQQGLCAELRSAFRDKERSKLEVTTPYWRARYFKNGNLHLWCLRDDLRQKTNRLIAEHYGETLGAGHDAAKGKVDPTATAGSYGPEHEGFFETPHALAEHVASAANIEPDHIVLEPSAGHGRLAIAARDAGGSIICIEANSDRAILLEGLGFKVFCRDFLSVTAEPRFDRVLMNPPFALDQDVRHVMHAVGFLRPGGRLVAIMSAGIRSRHTRLMQAFHEMVERYGATIEDLPDDSFASEGTHVRTVLLILDMPGGVQA